MFARCFSLLENFVLEKHRTDRITKENQPDLSDGAIRDLLGDFLFVRLLIPALLRPHAHGLVGSAPSKHPSRTLALVRKAVRRLCVSEESMTSFQVTKMLRSVSERSTKDLEFYIEPVTNEFSEMNSKRVAEFLHRICEVQDADAANEVC